MSDKLNDLFELPSSDEIENIRKALHEQNDKMEKEAIEAESLSTELTPLAKQAMNQVAEREERVNQLVDLTEFDNDMDDLFKESMDAFREILSIAKDVPAPSMGKTLEAAAIMARIALDSKNSKIKARLDAIDLALKKQRVDEVTKKDEENNPQDVSGAFLNRNQLLAHIKSELGDDFIKDKTKPLV